MKYICKRCSHRWNPRKKEKPTICPNCKTPYWNKPTKITKEQTLRIKDKLIDIHNKIIHNTGGEFGIRDDGGLHYAIFNILKFQNRENPIKTAAFVFDDLAKKHYFVDGNKRTAYIFTKILLINQGFHLSLNYKNSVDFILKIARYKNPKTKREIESWIKKYIKRINEKEIDKYLKEIYYDLTHGEENDKER
ncbi:type II toxin-antitoxin system death-on-curing family toxin [archaeon]|jgi:death on curing protein|nr:type II toxin-antitoxin system death-on-curing family toxin [archaeon]MBT3731324.1 type II toxin-antitoxin system death-on-curing family toxin [archaeon]MBT4670373.1 type II toxin-antitoxin system death-on-curing family toxin [archaeon]MBT5030192.1 type II toxin-antitoxin system death-on-curing family toxin [archaeon]MBT5287741.1 type II toxin-antitoxin system death-on-curing family toxin [archaeon]